MMSDLRSIVSNLQGNNLSGFRYSEHYNLVMQRTSYLKKATTRQRFWHILNGESVPGCVVCGSTVRWDETLQAYRKTCSAKCSRKSTHEQELRVEKSLARYGTEHPIASNEVQAKIKTSNQRKLGVDYPFQDDGVQQKTKTTHNARYSGNPACHKSVRKKKEDTNIERYGAACSLSNSDVNKKAQDTLEERYGVRAPFASKEIREKSKRTLLARYGRDNASRIPIPDNVLEKVCNKEWLETEHTGGKTLLQISNELDVSQSLIPKRFKNFGIDVCRFGGSVGQRELQEFIASIYSGVVLQNDRSLGMEIDVYLPEEKIGFEYNGLYWHSEDMQPNRNYHLEKTACAQRHGVRLVHVFENEWLHNSDIVKGRVCDILGSSPEEMDAAECRIRKVGEEEKKDFLNANHLQGDCRTHIDLGLYASNELVAIMSFGKPRVLTHDFELLRYCTKMGLLVLDGGKRLFNKFVSKHPECSIVSASDRRWNTGNFYKTLGFVHTHDSPPVYWYFSSDGSLQHRTRFKKHRLSKMFSNFDSAISEYENMKNNGYRRVWDCGTSVYVYGASDNR